MPFTEVSHLDTILAFMYVKKIFHMSLAGFIFELNSNRLSFVILAFYIHKQFIIHVHSHSRKKTLPESSTVASEMILEKKSSK